MTASGVGQAMICSSVPDQRSFWDLVAAFQVGHAPVADQAAAEDCVSAVPAPAR